MSAPVAPASPRRLAQGKRAMGEAMLLAEERRWVRVRLLGWTLLGAWQVLSLASEYFPVLDLESRALRVTGKVLGLVGLVLIAYGFERLVKVAHLKARAHEHLLRERWLRERGGPS